jgi:putative MATE family efflux protein
MDYLKLIMLQMPLFALAQVYAGTLRETNQTKVPMVASIVAFSCNLIGNYILIFGKLGLPALGVKGAAIATVAARFAELLVLVIYSHVKRDKYVAFKSLYKSIKLPLPLFKSITKKGLPILLNETLWSMSIAILAQIYSRRGLDVVASYNIASTINNLFSVVVIAMGTTVAIILGNYLGSGKTEEAVTANKRLTWMSVLSSLVMGLILVATSSLIPSFYNTEDSVKQIASQFIFIFACFMPINAFVSCAYFTMRAGGKTFITMLFDSIYEIAINVPVALLLVSFTNLTAPLIYTVVWGLVGVKSIVGHILVKNRLWLNDLTKISG